MKRGVISLAVVLLLSCLVFIGWGTAWSSPLYADSTPYVPDEGGVISQLERAIQVAIETKGAYAYADPIFNVRADRIRLSQDQTWASGWVVFTDPDTGVVLPTEPGIVLARWDGVAWVVTLPSDTEWIEVLQAAPDDIIPVEDKSMWLAVNQTIEAGDQVAALSGFLLPWIAGQPASLSRSVSHDGDYPSGNAHYSFDFYVPGETVCPSGSSGVNGITGLNYNLYASKSGTVWSYKDTVENCDHSDVNFLVIQNADNPTYFQLYMHLAQDSIPPSLKQVGAQVVQGQFIGVVDNTGQSTGSHLHFQVQLQPHWPPENPYWGKSVDIVFDEVDIYGGRPRREWEYDEEICGGTCEDGRRDYISANVPKGDLTPPVGNLSGVTTGDLIESDTLVLSGWGRDDDSGLHFGQLIAGFGGVWHELGEPFTSTFSYQWELCDENNPVPDGAVSVALRLFDNDGNWTSYAGLRHFTKNFTCPAPPSACMPGANQVSLYEGLDYSGGCVLYGVGEYLDGASLGALGDDDAAAIRVGANVLATLYSEPGYGGHAETFAGSDSYLVDNRISMDTVSSMRVALRNSVPLAPTLLMPWNGNDYYRGDLIPISWVDGGAATRFQVRYTPEASSPIMLDWGTDPYVYLDSLGEGSYTYEVRGGNDFNTSPWSQSETFTVSATAPMGTPVPIPYEDDMESSQGSWSSTGYWSLKDNADLARSGTHAWWYQGADGDYDEDGYGTYGSLTSPPISITMPGYYLRFWYRYETETHGSEWDQRWVQIAVDGGDFSNIFQPYDDPQILETVSWLQSPIFDLSAYAGHVIQVRFSFYSLDSIFNGYDGWAIDDFSVTDTPPPACTDNLQDDTPQDATLIEYTELLTTTAQICPGGDYDYYKFVGGEGDRIVVDIDAKIFGSALDPYVVLLDSDGTSVLAEHDDEVIGVLRDPLLFYTLPQAGTYYLQVRAWDHPSAGSDDHNYSLRLYVDDEDPIASIIYPASGAYLPGDTITVTAQVDDVFNGVSRVEFFWHGSNWLVPAWIELGTDWDGQDGWGYLFDPGAYKEQEGAAFYITAYDKAGNWIGAGAWNVGIDKTPPSTAIRPLEPTQNSTAVFIQWNGTDKGSGIDYVDLQYQEDGGPWQNYPQVISGTYSGYWAVMSAGHSYGFRMRGVDHVGNVESFPGTAEVTTAIPGPDVLCSNPDPYEIDNDHVNASPLTVNGSLQLHNLCNPEATDRLNDQDWIMFDVQAGERYYVQAFPMSSDVATVLSLYASDGTTLLIESTTPGYGRLTTLDWIAEQDGVVYLQIRNLDGRVIGNDVSYLVRVQEGYYIYLPWTENNSQGGQ